MMRRKQRLSFNSLRRPLFDVLATLPAGQYRVAMALIADGSARTYPAVAAELGIHLGTVHQHLRRIRHQHPGIYAELMKERARQLAERHRRALARAKAHSREWHEKTKHLYINPFGR
jgi:DNA-directed RNA polymerase specialized sigma24 family protein